MPQEFPGRIHGDGRLIIDDSFYTPLSEKETPVYINKLSDILNQVNIKIKIDEKDPNLSSTLLALKQRFMIGYSNGCPWPEKAIGEYLQSQATPPQTLEQLTSQIVDSQKEDGKHSFLFQDLLQHASEPLKSELLSYHPWTPITGQEDRNLPKDITGTGEKGAYGLAYDPPYFNVLIPLYKYIDDEAQAGTPQSRFSAVSDFFEIEAKSTETIESLVEKTQEFLKTPQKYLNPYLPTSE